MVIMIIYRILSSFHSTLRKNSEEIYRSQLFTVILIEGWMARLILVPHNFTLRKQDSKWSVPTITQTRSLDTSISRYSDLLVLR